MNAEQHIQAIPSTIQIGVRHNKQSTQTAQLTDKPLRYMTMEMNFTEALSHYKIDFDVETMPLSYLNAEGQHATLNGVKGMRRVDTLEALEGVSVGNRYKVIQTASYADIGDRIVRDNKLEFVNGGMMKGGRVSFLQAKFPDSIRVLQSDDTVEKYLTFVNSFDGSSPFYILPTMLRIVCTNQFAALATSARADGLRIRHTISSVERVKQADEALLEMMGAYRSIELKINSLAVTPFSDKMMDTATRKLFSVKPDVLEVDIASRTLNNMGKVRELFETGIGLDQWRGTAWSAFNSCTEFSDHHRSLRATTDPFEARLIGSGASFKDRALRAIEQTIVEAA